MVNAIDNKSVLLVSMPFADPIIPSIQLSLLESYLTQKNITATSIHLYLFAAQIYGLAPYLFLINPPNDSYASQMIFSKYVFPKHYEENRNHFKEYFNSVMKIDQAQDKGLNFEQYEQKSDEFYHWATQNVPWQTYDIIGFSLNYGQLLPSLAIAHYIKQQYPDIIIVCGGSTAINDLGRRLLDAFPCIDYVISGDGEESLHQLAVVDEKHYQNIPGLTRRKNGKATNPKPNNGIALDTLPFLDFTSFFQNLEMVSSDIQQYFQLNGKLPIEISRGCWWNKCSFCNQQAYHPCYRQKNIDRFVAELSFLSETYTMLSFQIIGSTLPYRDIGTLCTKIISLKKDFSFIAETRADTLRKKDYHLLKQAGFDTIQTGIETFSKQYLKKMKKGARVIDNLAALKFCKELDINNEYNIIINFPTEDIQDFQETVDIIGLVHPFLDPPRISSFVVGFQSPIYHELEKYNIKTLKNKRSDKIMFPEHILKQNIHFFYDYVPMKKPPNLEWTGLVNGWVQERMSRQQLAVKTKKPLDNYVYYYIDGGSFIKIYDKRDSNNINIFILNEIERLVFLLCADIIHFVQIRDSLKDIDEHQLKETLHDLIAQGIIYEEDDWYLSLPLCISTPKTPINQQLNSERINESYLIS